MIAARSFRFRLLVVATLCILGALAVAGASLVELFERQMLRRVGQELDVRWAELGRSFSINDQNEPELSPQPSDPRYHAPYSGAYWQISENGVPVLRSRSLWDRSLDTTARQAASAGPHWFEIEIWGGRELYIVERVVELETKDAPRRFTLLIALDHDEIAQARDVFGWDVVRILAPIAIVLVVGVWLQLWLTLHPLKRLARELNAIREGRQGRFQSAMPKEVAPLADDLNQLLDQQDHSVAKARERAGALAHGLKTPLAILSAEARRLDTKGEPDSAAQIREQVTAMQTHVTRELARARTRGALATLGAHVDAAKAAERMLGVMRRLPRGDLLDWRCVAPANLMLRMDPDDFGEVLGNLLDNARKWAATSVTVRFEPRDAAVEVSVEDDGPGFGSDDRPLSSRAAEPDDSAGLGLAIVQDVLAAYDTALTVDRAASFGHATFSIATGAPLDRTEGLPASEPSGATAPNAVVMATALKTSAVRAA